MIVMFKGLHHFHLRKRIHEHHEPYPHPDKWKRLMDKLIYVVGIASPIMTLPQLFTIWIDGNTSGVSLITWASYEVFSVFWLIYGIMHREKPIIITQCLLLFVKALIIIGILVN